MTKKPKQKTPDKIAGLQIVEEQLRAADPATRVIRVVPVLMARPVSACVGVDTAHWVDDWLSDCSTLMVRPCPMEPRHGFIPSQAVESQEEFDAIVHEVAKASTSAWIMVNPYIFSSYSAVVTQNSIAVGESNNGVTAGGRAVTLPMGLRFPKKLATRCLEVVVDGVDRSATIVQAKKLGRDVANKTMHGDYIPEDLIVREVVDAAPYSDLEWEELTVSTRWWSRWGNDKVPYRPVAYLGHASLLSHKALWCITRGIPCIVTHRPEVGEKLTATRPAECTLGEEEYDMAVHYGMNEVFKRGASPSQIALAVVHAIHHYDALVRQRDSKLFLVSALAAFAKLLIAACIREASYATRYWDAPGVPGLSELPVVALGLGDIGDEARNRLCASLVMTPGLVGIIRRTHDMFSKFHWSSAAYGGMRWAEIASELGEMVHGLYDRNLPHAAWRANGLLNKMHNLNFVLDKYMGARTGYLLDGVSQGAWDIAIEAVPGIAALCNFIFSKYYRNRKPPRGDFLNVTSSALEGYHKHGVGTVIAGQEVVVRDEDSARNLAIHLCNKFSKVIETNNVFVSRTFFDSSGREINRLLYPLSRSIDECVPDNTTWEAVRLNLNAPAVYDNGVNIGIILNHKWHGIGATTHRMAAFHLYEVDNVNLILGEAVNCVPTGEPALLIEGKALTDAVCFGFGLNFNAIEAPVVYSMALDLAGRLAVHSPSWIYGVALGMTLRYLFSVALWAESVSRDDQALKGVFDIRLGPPGIGLVPRDKLLDAVIHHEFDLEFVDRVLARPVCGMWWDEVRSGLEGMVKLMNWYRWHGVIPEEPLSFAVGKFREMYRPAALNVRWVWNPEVSGVSRLDVPGTGSLHIADMIYGMAVTWKAALQ